MDEQLSEWVKRAVSLFSATVSIQDERLLPRLSLLPSYLVI